MFSVLSIARCIASPTSAISSPTLVAASEILTWASAAEYRALITSLLERNASILVSELLLGGGQRQPLGANEARSAGVGLLGVASTPLQTIRSVPVHTISLESLELSGDGPGVSVLQLSVRGL